MDYMEYNVYSNDDKGGDKDGKDGDKDKAKRHYLREGRSFEHSKGSQLTKISQS